MKRLLIDHQEDAVFTAVSENGKITELFIDPSEIGSWVGRVIVGRIKTILPGQFSFVDIGAKKNAFINLQKGHGLKAGQAVLVRVVKDASGTKGMCVSLEISLKGRFVILEKGQTVGVSKKITDENEARRLKKIARKNLPGGFGAIIRTNAENQLSQTIIDEIEYLHKTFLEITSQAEFIRPPATLFPKHSGLFSDILSDDLQEIIISAEDDEFAATKAAVCEIMPAAEKIISRQKLNLRIKPQKEVRLPCGGFITVEQTEACVVIDVNTGGNVGKTDYGETVLETNLEAAVEIAAQIRLRNLSGIIIVDFIDMQSESDKTRLLEVLSAEIKKDRVKTEIIGFIGLGMVQMTRRRTRPPISELLQSKCPHCGCIS